MAMLLGVAAPQIGLAQQASGDVRPPGVPINAPSQLPTAGNAATDDDRALAAVLLGGVAALAGLILRRRAERQPRQRGPE
jgi:hypothetical protein